MEKEDEKKDEEEKRKKKSSFPLSLMTPPLLPSQCSLIQSERQILNDWQPYLLSSKLVYCSPAEGFANTHLGSDCLYKKGSKFLEQRTSHCFVFFQVYKVVFSALATMWFHHTLFQLKKNVAYFYKEKEFWL